MNTNTSMTHYMSSRLDGIFIPSNQIFIDGHGGVKTIIQLSYNIVKLRNCKDFKNLFFHIWRQNLIFIHLVPPDTFSRA